MSTYTDLHNRIKENVTILRKPGSKDDGMSPQKVILINPENQFYGTFNGAMNIKGGTLSDLTLVGGTIDGTTIKNASFLDGDTPVPIGEIAAAVSDHEQRLTQAEADIKAVSAAHNALSGDLSGAIGDLSVKVNQKIDNAVADIERSIGGVVTDVKDLSDDLGELSGKLETLSTSMLNGVVYKGKLPLTQNSYDNPGLMFYRKVPCCLLNGTQDPLVNGWMFKVVLDKSKLTSDYVTVNDPNTLSTIYLGEGDYVIIKNHNINEYKVIPDETMRMDDFDVLNAQDEDDTKIHIIKALSTYFENKTNDISSSLCAEIEADRATIASVSSETLDLAKAYTNQEIDGLSSTTKILVAETSAEITSQVDADFVHKAGDSIESLTVDNDLVVDGSTSLLGPLVVEDRDTSLAVSGSEVKLAAEKPIEVKTTEGISFTAKGRTQIQTKGPVVLSGSNLSAHLKDKVCFYNERGLDGLYVNDKSIQATLDDLSNALDASKYDRELGEEVSVHVDAIQDYVDELSGAHGSEGIIKYLSDEISVLRADEKYELQLGKIDVFNEAVGDGRYPSIGHFLCAMLEPGTIDVRNNSGYVVEFASDVPLSARVLIADGRGTTLGHGDTIYIHELSVQEAAPIRIPFADLTPFSRENQSGNTFIIQAGVSRYEFEDQVKKLDDEIADRVAADAHISSWIQRNFGNTGDDNELTTTVLNQEISAKSSLSVDGAAYALGDLSAAKQLFVNNGQLAVASDGETTSVEAVADMVKLASGAAAVAVTAEKIAAESAEVEVDALSSVKIAVDGVEAVNATSSQVEVFSTLSVAEDLATATALSAGALSADTLAARQAEVTESLDVLDGTLKVEEGKVSESALSIELSSPSASVSLHDGEVAVSADTLVKINDALAASQDGVSVDFSKTVDLSLGVSITDICVDLSTQLSNEIEARISSDDALSNDYVERIGALSADLSAELSTEIETRKSEDAFLSSAVSTKIWIEDRANDPSDISTYTDLSIIKISKDEYEDLAIGPTHLCANVLYVVESDYVDAYGQEIKNVLSSTEKTNAATVGQVDDAVSEAHAYADQICSDLSVCIDDNYVHVSGDTISGTLSVVNGGCIVVFNENGFKPTQYRSNQIVTPDITLDIPSKLSNAYASETIASREWSTSRFYQKSETSSAAQISTSVAGLGSRITNEQSYRKNADTYLSSEISSKVWIADEVDHTISGSSSLSVVKISKDDYEQLVATAQPGDAKLSTNVLYVVDSIYIDAYGQQIKNLSAASELSDAVPFNQLLSGLGTKQDTVGDLGNIRLSAESAVPKSAISAALSVLDEDPLSSLTTDSMLSDVIGAVVTMRNALSALRDILG